MISNFMKIKQPVENFLPVCHGNRERMRVENKEFVKQNI